MCDMHYDAKWKWLKNYVQKGFENTDTLRNHIKSQNPDAEEGLIGGQWLVYNNVLDKMKQYEQDQTLR